MRQGIMLAMIVCSVAGLVGCSESQGVAPAAPTGAVASSGAPLLSGSSAATATAGLTKIPIAGTLDYLSESQPGRMVMTPSDMCHLWEYPVHDVFDGDVEGPVTFFEQGHGPCDFSHLAGSGPFIADVTWHGRRLGEIAEAIAYW